MANAKDCRGAGEGFSLARRGGGASWNTDYRNCSACGKRLKLKNGRIPPHVPAKSKPEDADDDD